MLPEWVAGCYRNRWPNVTGMGGRMLPEWVAECFRNTQLTVNNQKEHVVGLKERQWTIIHILGIFYESLYS